jgi:hypothetical protein
MGRIFTSLCLIDRLWGTTNEPLVDTGVLSPEVKRPERETDHSPTSAEEKRVWICTFTPLYVFIRDS